MVSWSIDVEMSIQNKHTGLTDLEKKPSSQQSVCPPPPAPRQVQEGDTVVFEMVDVHTMLLNIVQRASGSRIKILRAKAEAAAVAAAAAGHGHPGLGQHLHPGLGGPGPEGGLGPHGGLGPGLAAPDLLALMHQQAGYMQGGGGPGGPPPPHGLGGPGHAPPGMASQLAAAPAPGGGGGSMLGPPRLPSPVDPYAHGGPGPSPGYHPNGTPGPSPLDYLGGAHGHGHGHGHVPPGSLDHQDKRPRTELGLPGGPPGVAGPGAGGASSGIAMLSDVADLDLLMQENLILREELRAAEGKIAMLESGVLNIKAVLTKSTDPGLVAMTGVMNLLNQLESGDLTPDVPPHVRIALQGVCSEIRRHLNGVMRMVWVLRSLPEDVQRENGAGGPGGPPPGMDPQQQQ